MYKTIVATGDSTVISSGTIIQFNGQPIKFNVDFPGFPLNIIMNFENNLDHETKMEPKSIDNSTISLTFYNYNNPLGTGTPKALKIADYQGIPIFLNYRIYALNDNSDKTVHYTLYMNEVPYE